jgi:hypothetical protein
MIKQPTFEIFFGCNSVKVRKQEGVKKEERKMADPSVLPKILAGARLRGRLVSLAPPLAPSSLAPPSVLAVS